MRTRHTPSRQIADYWKDCTIPTLADVCSCEMKQSATKEKSSERGLMNSAAELLPGGTVIFSRTASVGFAFIETRFRQ
jgi:type I restriction enzyme S subunit